MPPKQAEIWNTFHRSDDKPNGSHHRATHWRCIDAERPSTAAIDVDLGSDWDLMKEEEWFMTALASALSKKKDVNGEKGAMAGHLRKCEFTTSEEKALAARAAPTKKEREEAEKRDKIKRKQPGGGEEDVEADDEGPGGSRKGKKRKLVQAVETSFSQSTLKVYRGNDIPFSEDQKSGIARQTLRATQSANLPERWTSDPEVMKLFMMLRSRAMDAIPSRRQLGGTLLAQAAAEIDAKIAAQVKGQDVLMCTDGWRTNRKDAVGGVTLTHKFKDGESLKRQFEEMIDEAENRLGCYVIAFLTDNDGGSKKGRILLAAARLYLLVFPCCSHQGQLILGDYLKENKEAAKLMGELIDFVNWLNSHDKVRAIFDTRQQVTVGKILAYLLPNLTRWTTHLVAAIRFDFLKIPIRAAILNDRDAIVKAQIGAETNPRKRQALEDDAVHYCDLVESNTWWDKLRNTVIPDLEHICYLTNIAQSDHVRPDQFLLALGGLFLHFHGFSGRTKSAERALGQRMCKRIEKRFKELDQVVFVLALILNPFEKLSRFGDKAHIDVFKISTELIKLFERMSSCPPKLPRSAAEQTEFDSKLKEKVQAVNIVFMQYLSETGPFESWFAEGSPQRESFHKIHADNPIPFWEMLQTNKAVLPLANFALQLLHLVVNQAGLERLFSDFTNKKNKKRNRLGLKKMGQQATVTRYIHDEQKAEGLVEDRAGRKNHADSRVQELLSVPRYADAILSDTDDSDNEGEKKSVVVRTSAAWRKQVAEWQAEVQELDRVSDDLSDVDRAEDDDEDLPPNIPIPPPNAVPAGRGRAPRSWFPTTLATLFGGVIDNPITLARREKVVSEESLYMELLAAEHSDEEPDAGAQEGSGDDYEG
ncbi:ribonuclease H-like domain-containing protein [Mycena pura]|uniref:Ribonuclease H-like domain-containing protein n=1 Tax=Mycena pura TaxID=153505 RepID=A0AAD6V8W9_9AGAR|nr:ribonuclease H-like domain-containing protein [Mycena pura]